MDTWTRVVRHLRLTLRNYPWGDPPSPPLLILFINSICHQTCEHCFYWRNLNRNDDLTVEELRQLSKDLGRVENLNLSGGEPFLRQEFGEICRFFIQNNGVKQIYVPTNGSFTDRTLRALSEVFREPGLRLFAVELSLDGMPENRLGPDDEPVAVAIQPLARLRRKLQVTDRDTSLGIPFIVLPPSRFPPLIRPEGFSGQQLQFSVYQVNVS